MKESKVLVSIICNTYNHEKYIRQCLEGFIMQKTTFSFEVLIHDDASTDKTADIIREYEKKYPNIINPIYQTENQYSKKIKINAIYNYPRIKGKYIALCEGDDYWIDPLKLQKQVDFLESNPEYTLCCSDAIIQTKDKELNWNRYQKNQTIPVEDIILGGGLFIQTATLILKSELISNDTYPEFAQKCHVGDYPLQIYAALNGKVYWFNEKQAVYRYEISHNSWTNRISKQNIEDKIRGWRSEVNMLQGMDKLSNHRYSDAFKKRQNLYIYNLLLINYTNHSIIKEEFKDVINLFNNKQKIDLFLISINCTNLVRIYNRIRLLINKLDN